MYKIVKKQELTTNIYLMEVEADRVAKTCEPGQFVIVRMDSESERIPLTLSLIHIYWFFAIHTGRSPKPSSVSLFNCFAAAGANTTSDAP